jgi:PHD/YefM family antitoxin component YafN of YafNO toxin-antitoxin module
VIELTEQQIQAVENPEVSPLRIMNPRPRTKETFVLLPVDEYERMMEDEEYDDSPWTREELEALAWEAGKSIGWEDMDEYDEDEAPEKT